MPLFGGIKNTVVLEGLRGEESIASSTVVKALTVMFTIAGRRSFWKLARNEYPVIRPVKRLPMKSKIPC